VPSVGILTFHHVHNFGAVMQAWALANTLSRLGHSTEVINYRPKGVHARTGWRALVPSIGHWKMSRFVERQLPLSPAVLPTRQDVDAYVRSRNIDKLVCGSDQVWMVDGRLGLDATYFLGVGGDAVKKRVSYAPSCGSMKSFGANAEEARDLLSRFSAISVRDETTRGAVEALGIEVSTRVVDPTLLTDFGALLGGSTRRRARREYLAVVGKTNPAAERFAHWAAKRLGVEVVGVGTRLTGADSKPFVGPREWLEYIAGARFVVTSLFHGAAVSLSLRRPFVAVDSAGRSFKLTDLFRFLEIEERFLEPDSAGSYPNAENLLEMSYAELGPRIQRRVDESMTFLKGALG